MWNKITILFVISLFVNQLSAQGSHFVVIDAPSTVAGSYKSWIANFGATYCNTETPIKGELAFFQALPAVRSDARLIII